MCVSGDIQAFAEIKDKLWKSYKTRLPLPASLLRAINEKSANPRHEAREGGEAMDTREKPKVVRKLFSFVYSICLGLATICAVAASSPRAVVAAGAIVIDQGPLKGISTPGEDQYLGIPYAAAPVGNLRWRPPQPPAHFKALFHATQFSNVCTQLQLGAGPLVGSEDCLYLNVYVPDTDPPAHGFPVMVWIHGGGLTWGAGSQYDPTPLVEKGDVIVVTINYRLGYLGFFAHPALDTEGHLAGNYGLLDQHLPLGPIARRDVAAKRTSERAIRAETQI